MCEFCENDGKHLLSTASWVELYTEVYGCGLAVKIIARGDSDAVYRPNFCPECGRNLRGGD